MITGKYWFQHDFGPPPGQCGGPVLHDSRGPFIRQEQPGGNVGCPIVWLSRFRTVVRSARSWGGAGGVSGSVVRGSWSAIAGRTSEWTPCASGGAFGWPKSAGRLRARSSMWAGEPTMEAGSWPRPVSRATLRGDAGCARLEVESRCDAGAANDDPDPWARQPGREGQRHLRAHRTRSGGTRASRAPHSRSAARIIPA